MKKLLLIIGIAGGALLFSCNTPNNEGEDAGKKENRNNADTIVIEDNVDIKEKDDKVKIDIDAKDGEGGFENKDMDIKIKIPKKDTSK